MYIYIYKQYIFLWYRSSATEPKIFIYDGKGVNTPLHVIEKIHTKQIVFIKVNNI